MKRGERKQKRKENKKQDGRPRQGIAEQVLSNLSLHYEFRIIVMVAILVAFGVVMVFSAGYYTTVSQFDDPYYYLKRQGFWALSGFVIMMIFSRIDYHVYMKIWPWILALSVGLLLLLMTPLGTTVNYATRWIYIGPIGITPSEISKLAMIICTSCFLARKPGRVRKLLPGVLPILIVMGVHAILIIKQPNLSTAIVICAIMIGIMFIAGLQYRYIALGGGALAAGTVYILTDPRFRHGHWYARLTNWIDPFADAQGEGYQVSQSLIALGNGGVKGLGLGNSIAKNLYLPEPQNDFILAIIGEELGFGGFLILMGVYLFLIWSCFMVAARAKDKLGLYLASGVTIMLALQVIINVAVVTASMPATGITLPFISYGGTSLWVFMASMGIVLNISRKEEQA